MSDRKYQKIGGPPRSLCQIRLLCQIIDTLKRGNARMSDLAYFGLCKTLREQRYPGSNGDGPVTKVLVLEDSPGKYKF